ncbi:FAST kinase domain-containing protein 2, mitochondrial [Mixophyes fleayi]|uniref:FAST kinase domain-containing protein 2, mitochondrial n=1 Tax=Mixophyes fleayi TaxID=3061075 RepID=UPI003F4D9215
MNKKTYLYMLRTVRLIKSCDPLVGMRIPTFTRNYSFKSVAPLPWGTHPWTKAPIRFLSQETSLELELKNCISLKDTSDSSDLNNVSLPKEDLDLETEVAHSMYEEKTKYQSAIMDAVQKCTSPCEVLDIFASNSHNESDLHSGIIKLWQIMSPHKKLKHFEEQLISEHPNLHNLCYGVMMVAPTMPTGFLVRSLYVFVSLKVNQKSRIIQTLLIICQKRLSMLREEHVSILADCLKMMESDRNVDILNSGLQLLIEFKLEDIKTVTSLQNLMKSLGRDAPLHLKLRFKKKALRMIDKFSAIQCQNMLSVLATIDFHAYDLLNACSLRLIGCIDELTYEDINTILYCCFKLSYFNEKLLSAIGDNIMNTIDTWTIWQIAVILQNMSKLNYRHVPLLDYFAEDIMQHSDSLSIKDLLRTSRIFSSVNHLPEGKGDQFLGTLNKSLMLNLDMIKSSQLLGIVYSFCLLGFLPHSAINKLLKDESILSTENKKDIALLNHIKLCSMMDMSSQECLQDLKKAPVMCAASIQRFHTYLQNYIGDPNLYQHSMQIPNSYYIDFVLALDTKQNKLVPVEDIQTGDRSNNIARIAVLCLSKSAFTLGTFHPVGNVAAKIRHIKYHGFDVVLVPVHQFFKLSEEGKVEFVRKNIFRESSGSQNEVEAKQSEQSLYEDPNDT